MSQQISNTGVSLIKGFEGFSSKPYQDSVGVWTIGYGHTEGVGPNSAHLTEPQASALLKRDLDNKYAPFVNALKLPLNQNQFDALVSFVYNVGPGGVVASTHIGQALRAHAWVAAANDLLEWDKAGGQTLLGLKRRREAERNLFLKAVANPPYFTANEKRWIAEYDKLHKANPTGPRQRALRRAMAADRKAIWVAAHVPGGGGWNKLNRLGRYNALKKRTS
jgi:GH24 family phage-related lysozyme (muramidase)